MIRSFFSIWMGLGVTGIISVLLTPLLVHGLGPFYFGMWVLVASVLDYYGLLDMGVRYTLQRYVGRFKGTSEREALNQTLVTAQAVALIISALVCLLTVVLAIVLPDFFGVTGASRSVFRWLVVLQGLSVAIAFPARLLGAYLCGLQRFDLYNLAAVAAAIVRAVLFLGVLRWGYGVLGVAVVSLGIAAFSLVLHLWLVRRADPQVDLSWRQTSWARMRELVYFSFYVFLGNFGDQLRFYTDSLVIGRLLGVAAITPFNVVTRLMDYFRVVAYPLTGPLTPAMSALDAQGRAQDLKRLFLRTTRLTALFSLLVSSLLVLDGRALLRVWMGEAFTSSYSLLVVLTAGYMVALAQTPSQILLYARARHKALGWWTLGEGLANLLLSIALGMRYGLMGVALGTTVPMLLVRLFLQPWYVLRVAGISAAEYVGAALLRPVAAGALFILICSFRGGPQASAAILPFAWGVAWKLALFGLLAWSVGCDGSDRRLLWDRGKQFATSLRLVRAG